MTRQGQRSTIWVGKTSSPLGTIWVAVSTQGILAIDMHINQAEFTRWLEKRTHSTVILDQEKVSPAAQQIVEYLQGRRKGFELSIDWSLMTPFQKQVLQATYAIPYGETRTYGEIAAYVGKPGAARAVGQAQAANPLPLVIPCHRVIGADGGLRGYGGAEGIPTKAWLLQLEGAIAR
ncbi:MAG: methylated-DNA--[protein]-cysteine S-methyltransferase [Chloroflexota bacterium]